MIANYHTHTPLCHHAQDSEREYVETGIARGLKILGFSDHSPYIFPGEYYSGHRMFPEWTEKYFRTLTDLQAEYKKEIEIHIGFEMEYYPELFEKTLRFLEPYPCEYLILGQHFLDNEYDTGIYSGSESDKAARLKHYVNQTLDGLRTGKFTYLAHPDLVRFSGDQKIYRREITRLCREVKAMGLPLEINALGLQTNRHYPCDKFFSIAAEVGNPVIIGCDAHDADSVAHPEIYRQCLEFAKKHGLEVWEPVPLRGLKSEAFLK